MWSELEIVQYIRRNYSPMLQCASSGLSSDATGAGIDESILAGIMMRETRGGFGFGSSTSTAASLGHTIRSRGPDILGDYSRRKGHTAAMYHGYGLFQIDDGSHDPFLQQLAPNYQGHRAPGLFTVDERLAQSEGLAGDLCPAPTPWARANAFKAVDVLNNGALRWRRLLTKKHRDHGGAGSGDTCNDSLCRKLRNSARRIILIWYNSGKSATAIVSDLNNNRDIDRDTHGNNYSSEVIRLAALYGTTS